VKVFFDATVWCGALIRPAQINAQLLALAAQGGPLRGVTSDVVLLEFYRHAVDGALGRSYDVEDVWDLVLAHEPLLEIEQAPIGRSLPQRSDLHNLPLNEIVYHLTGESREDLLDELSDRRTLAEFDANDLHVLAAAVRSGADAICSSDGVFEPVGRIEIYRPGQLAAEYGF
jgi:predicted nucleic acid-binding protein